MKVAIFILVLEIIINSSFKLLIDEVIKFIVFQRAVKLSFIIIILIALKAKIIMVEIKFIK